MALEHIGRGPKSEIDATVIAGDLKSGDIVVTTGEKGNELVLIERDNSKVVVKSRTQNDILVQGVNLSDSVKDGVTLEAGMDLEDFVKKLVQKRIAATYTQPSVTIANNGGQAATVVETGTSVNVKVKSTFKAGDAGAITSHTIKKGADVVETVTTADATHEETMVVADGATTFSSSVAYEEGVVKNDNLGDASPNGHILAGTKNSSNYTITGARKAFYGTGAGTAPELNSANIRALTGSKLNPAAGNIINLTVGVGEQYIIVSLPSARTLKQVTYVDLGDKGMLEKFTLTKVDVQGASADVAVDNSNTYVFQMASPAEAAMNFEFLLQ